MNYSLAILSILSFTEMSYANPVEHQIALHESLDIEARKGENFLIEGEKYVAIVRLAKEKIRVIGARPGMSIVKIIPAGGVDALPVKIYQIRVVKDAKPNRLNKWSKRMKRMCTKHSALTCVDGYYTIEGKLDDYRVWIDLKFICLAEQLCTSDVGLSRSALRKLEFSLNKNTGISVSNARIENGKILLDRKCNSEMEDDQFKISLYGFLHSRMNRISSINEIVSERCLDDKGATEFLAEFFVIESNQQQLSSLNISELLKGTFGSANNDMSRFQQIDGLLSDSGNANRKSKAWLFASPKVYIRAGQRIEIRSGGQIESIQENYHSGSKNNANSKYWKDFGVAMHVSLQSVLKNELELGFDVNVWQPSKNGKRLQLQGASLKGNRLVKTGNLYPLGSINIGSQSSEELNSSIFEKIPIISPIFRSRQKGQASSFLIIFSKITPV